MLKTIRLKNSGKPLTLKNRDCGNSMMSDGKWKKKELVKRKWKQTMPRSKN